MTGGELEGGSADAAPGPVLAPASKAAATELAPADPCAGPLATTRNAESEKPKLESEILLLAGGRNPDNNKKTLRAEDNDRENEAAADNNKTDLLARFREAVSIEDRGDVAVDDRDVDLSVKTLEPVDIVSFREAVAAEAAEDAADEDWSDIELSQKTIGIDDSGKTLMSADVPCIDDDADEADDDWSAQSTGTEDAADDAAGDVDSRAAANCGEAADAENQMQMVNALETAAGAAGGDKLPKVVQVNVGGKILATTSQTLMRADWLLAAYARGEEACMRDAAGNIFVDQDPAFAELCLRILRSSREGDLVDATQAALKVVPAYGSKAFLDMLDAARLFRFEPVLAVLRREALAHVDQATANVVQGLEAEKREVLTKLKRAGKSREQLRIEVRRIELEISKALILDKHRRDHWTDPAHAPELSFNLIIVGNSGAGKSSTMQTILNSDAVCKVSGSQAQGTRGAHLSDGRVDGNLMSYIDTQGLGADTSVTDVELLEQIMLSTNAILRMKVISNILMAMDLRERATPAVVGNYLTFTELFQELQGTCFLCFTKWNTNNVMHEWNAPLKAWRKKWRRAETIEEITELPPSYADLYEAYTGFLADALGDDEQDTAFAKLTSVLAFFDSRIVWAFNLDAAQQEQRKEGTLEPYIEVMYRYYRKEAVRVLEQGRREVPTEEMRFLRHDRDTLKNLARDLIHNRNQHLGLLEKVSRDHRRRQRLKEVFKDMTKNVSVKMVRRNLSDSSYTKQVSGVVGIVRNTVDFGCSIS